MMLTGQRDADLVILDKLDDKDLFNFCSVSKEANRLCSIESFWRNRFIRKYGIDAVQYKSQEKSWRNFYIQIVYYLNESQNKIDDAMSLAAKNGNLSAVKFFIFKGAADFNKGLFSAARGGHKEIVDFFIGKGAKDWSKGMLGASQGGHIDLLDFFIQKIEQKRDSPNFDIALFYAGLGNKPEMAKYLISKGVIDINWGLYGAAKGGHLDLANFFISRGANNFSGALKYAQKGGYLDSVNFFNEKVKKSY